MFMLFVKSLPLVVPFLKELAFGSNVPTAGRTRNKLTPVVVIMAFVFVMVAAWGITELYQNYDKEQASTLRITTLEQQLDHERTYRKRVDDAIEQVNAELKLLKEAGVARETRITEMRDREGELAMELRAAQTTNQELRVALENAVKDNRQLLASLERYTKTEQQTTARRHYQKRHQGYLKLLEEQ